ncbi:MAG: hypothetical protein CVV23_08490 [Ignavibacteriae bacterium HGW-Ignavibacteriae-2]|jgi:hypothetical protein|nr:MAG: hypothetical protein CVV23_08490 [Ignavibacteriae bacterium HGW-Ignavibacteriae-2]
MTVAIHQPNFIPWIGFFYKIMKADVFVMLDDVQFTKNSFINRNKIKSQNGEQWLTQPVKHSGKFGQQINKVEIINHTKSFSKIKSSIRTNYGKSEYFSEIFDIIDSNLDNESNLVKVNVNLIKTFCSYMGFDNKIVFSSSLSTVGDSTDRLISICKELKASNYLAGFGSKNYQESEKFSAEGIQCDIYNFIHPVYNQLWGEFIYNLSIIDFLFNVGPNAQKYLK